jgi:hypothetical protein
MRQRTSLKRTATPCLKCSTTTNRQPFQRLTPASIHHSIEAKQEELFFCCFYLI